MKRLVPLAMSLKWITSCLIALLTNLSFLKVLSKMDISKFMKRENISNRWSVGNNLDKIFQKWVLFNQDRLMGEPQMYLLIDQFISDSVVWTYTNSAKSLIDERKCRFVANSYTAPLEKDFKIDANGAHAFMGHFLCGVETVKRFVNIRLHCNISNLKITSKIMTLQPLGNISADAHCYSHPFSKLWRMG